MVENIRQQENDISALESKVDFQLEALHVKPRHVALIKSFLEPLKLKDSKTYAHCLRVGLLTRGIAAHLQMDERPLFYAGLLHDLGKRDVATELLTKTDKWTKENATEMESHVLNGYHAIKNEFSFTADIIVRHHQFQGNKYPEQLPPHSHHYSPSTESLVMEYARILALADHYDALHRENSRFGPKRLLTSLEIEQEMLRSNPDKQELVEDLYRAGIFTR